MNYLHFSDICQIPLNWANPEIWQENCTKSHITKQAHSNNNAPVLATITFLPCLVILGWSLGVSLHRRYRTHRMIAQLHQIVALERLLRIKQHRGLQ